MTTIITGSYGDYLFVASDSRIEVDNKMYDFEDNAAKFFYSQKTIVSVCGGRAPFLILKSMFIDELVTMPLSEQDFKILGEEVMTKVLENYIGIVSATLWFTQKDRMISMIFNYDKKEIKVDIYNREKDKGLVLHDGSGSKYSKDAFDYLKTKGESFKDRLEVTKLAIEYAAEFDKGTGGKTNTMYVNTEKHELGYAAATSKAMIEIY